MRSGCPPNRERHERADVRMTLRAQLTARVHRHTASPQPQPWAGATRAPCAPGTRRDGPADSQAGQPGGRGEATSYRPRPAGQGDVMPLRPEPRTSRSDARLHPAGERARDPLAVRDDAAGRVTARPNARARHHSARRARGPKRATYDKPRGLSGDLTQAGSEKSRYPARGMPPPPSLRRSRPAFRVTGATPSGRPGPRATNSHKRQAGAAPFKKDRWAAWRAPVVAVPRHAGQRAFEAQARGHGGWRAGVAAGGTAAPRRAATQAGPAIKERRRDRARAAVSARARARWRPPLSVAGAHGRGRARALHSSLLVMQRS